VRDSLPQAAGLIYETMQYHGIKPRPATAAALLRATLPRRAGAGAEVGSTRAIAPTASLRPRGTPRCALPHAFSQTR
jgi:hypothetical protein